MARIALEVFARSMEAAYRGDRSNGLRPNLESVRPEEWGVRPLNPSVGDDSEFGHDPVLSIADIVEHVAGAKFWYAARLSGDDTLDWMDIGAPAHDMEVVLAWLDDGHRALEAALGALGDDADLAIERLTPRGRRVRTERLLSLVINHDIYHAGEINRQRGLIRGSDGWERAGAAAG